LNFSPERLRFPSSAHDIVRGDVHRNDRKNGFMTGGDRNARRRRLCGAPSDLVPTDTYMLSISDATVRDWLGRIRDGGPDTAHVRCFPPPPAASYDRFDRFDRVDRRFGEACALGRLSSRTYRTLADVGGYPFSVTAGETRLRRFADKRVNRGVARLFERVAGVTVGIDLDARLHASTLSLARRASRICQGATLSPWDLHHGHVVCRDGVHFLFHTQEVGG